MNTSKSGCAHCKRKTLNNTVCKCEKVVCLTCRQPEVHSCSFDYKAEFQQKLIKENPVIVTEKLTKI